VGRVRVGAHGGRTIGTRDLRDGRWHHLAVVLYPAASPDVGKHVMIYIDGELEPLSQRTFGPIDTRADEGVGVWLARDITTVTSGESQSDGRSFRGAIDEVSIHEGVLSQERIREIMRRAQ
jgi:hypothetical protein